MAKVTKRISMAMAVVFTAFAILTSATPALAAKKKVVKKAKKKVVAVKKTVKASTSASTASYNKALAAVKVAEGAFKYDMTNKDNVAYAQVKADLAQSAIDAVSDNSAKAYLGARLAVVMNKITVAQANLAKNVTPAEVKDVASATALNGTTVLVKFSKAQSFASAADFTFDGGLTVTNAAVKQDDNTTVVLTTSAQDTTKTYKVSYKGADTGLTVKGMAVATTPSAIVLSQKATQSQVGMNVTLTATVTPKSAGVPVTFNVIDTDTSTATLNTAIVKEVMTDSNGVASVTYTRYYGSNDSIRVYPTGAPTVADTGYAWWGSSKRLSITSNTTTAVSNGGVVTYTVNLKDANGNNLPNAYLNVLFKENLDASGTSATAASTSTNASTLTTTGSTLYVRNIAGQSPVMNILTLTTDSNGNASFSVTGTSTTATPVVYYTNDTTSNTTLANANTVKIDNTLMQLVADSAVFGSSKYTITTDLKNGTTTNATVGAEQDYVVTVKNADGTAFAGGLITVGINEILTGGVTTHARITDIYHDAGLSIDDSPVLYASNVGTTTDSTGYTKVSLTLNSNGQAEVGIKNTSSANEVATPVFWVDSNTNGLVESTESSYIAGTTLFLTAQVSGAGLKFYDTISQDSKIAGIDATKSVFVRLRAEDQSGNKIANALGGSTVTYTVNNTGANPLDIISVNAWDDSAKVASNCSNIQINSATQTLSGSNLATAYAVNPGSSATITATTTLPIVLLQVKPHSTTNTLSSMNIQGQFSVVLASGVTGSNLYSTSNLPFSWAKGNNLASSASGNLVYTGTVQSVQRTTDATGKKLADAFIKLDSGDYITVPLYTNDVTLQGTEYSNGAYIQPYMLSYRLTAGDKVQITLYETDGVAVNIPAGSPAGTLGINTNIWKFVNVDNSEDQTLTTPGVNGTAIPTTLTGVAATSTTDGAPIVPYSTTGGQPTILKIATATCGTAGTLTFVINGITVPVTFATTDNSAALVAGKINAATNLAGLGNAVAVVATADVNVTAPNNGTITDTPDATVAIGTISQTQAHADGTPVKAVYSFTFTTNPATSDIVTVTLGTSTVSLTGVASGATAGQYVVGANATATAANIATAIGSSITGYDVTSTGSTVVLTQHTPGTTGTAKLIVSIHR
jgi:hypothetical protein